MDYVNNYENFCINSIREPKNIFFGLSKCQLLTPEQCMSKTTLLVSLLNVFLYSSFWNIDCRGPCKESVSQGGM